MWQLFIKKPKKYTYSVIEILLLLTLMLLLFDLLFRREALRQQLNVFFINIKFLGDIERCPVGIVDIITVSLDCAIAAKVD